MIIIKDIYLTFFVMMLPSQAWSLVSYRTVKIFWYSLYKYYNKYRHVNIKYLWLYSLWKFMKYFNYKNYYDYFKNLFDQKIWRIPAKNTYCNTWRICGAYTWRTKSMDTSSICISFQRTHTSRIFCENTSRFRGCEYFKFFA